jgi:hypothetical protein
MPKVNVTLKDGRTARTYEDDYAFVMTLHETEGSPEGRWVQQPEDWKGGMGLFFVAMQVMAEVAAMKGNERFKVAARAALEAINKEGGNGSDNTDTKRAAKGRGKKRGDGEVSDGGCKGTEHGGCACHDASADACGEEDCK